jgi:hypothetical protein
VKRGATGSECCPKTALCCQRIDGIVRTRTVSFAANDLEISVPELHLDLAALGWALEPLSPRPSAGRPRLSAAADAFERAAKALTELPELPAPDTTSARALIATVVEALRRQGPGLAGRRRAGAALLVATEVGSINDLLDILERRHAQGAALASGLAREVLALAALAAELRRRIAPRPSRSAEPPRCRAAALVRLRSFRYHRPMTVVERQLYLTDQRPGHGRFFLLVLEVLRSDVFETWSRVGRIGVPGQRTSHYRGPNQAWAQAAFERAEAKRRRSGKHYVQSLIPIALRPPTDPAGGPIPELFSHPMLFAAAVEDPGFAAQHLDSFARRVEAVERPGGGRVLLLVGRPPSSVPIVLDLLEYGEHDLRDHPLYERAALLEQVRIEMTAGRGNPATWIWAPLISGRSKRQLLDTFLERALLRRLDARYDDPAGWLVTSSTLSD